APGPKPDGLVIIVADAGRTNLAPEVEALVNRGRRVIALDPFYFGESKIGKRDFLYGLLVAAVGERALGVQASQLAAIARWAGGEFKQGAPTLVAHGPRLGTAVLVAAALENSAIEQVELHDPLK